MKGEIIMNSKNLALILVIMAVSVYLGLEVLGLEIETTGSHHEKESHEDGKKETQGRHGGRLFGDKFQVELKIFEKGRPPEFRVFGFFQGQPLSPDAFQVEVRLKRLGEAEERIHFKSEQSYRVGNQIVKEPHSYEVQVYADYLGEKFTWKHSQVEGRVEMSQTALKRVGIGLDVAAPQTLIMERSLPGEIHYNKDRLAHVVPRVEGVVTEVFKNQGARVKRGELLAIIESREMAQMRGAFQASLRRLELARSTLDREERLWKQAKSAKQDFLLARESHAEAKISRDVAKQKLLALGLDPNSLLANSSIDSKAARFEVRSPMSGTVVEKHITLGEALKTNHKIFTVADLTQLWGEITVYAREVPSIYLGQSVRVRSRILNQVSTGKITYISSQFGRDTQSVQARVNLPNPKGHWRPGLFVDMSIVTTPVKVSVAVRRSAIQNINDQSVVFARFNDYFELRPLTLGRSNEDWVEVLDGLLVGQAYASSNSFLIKADLGKAGASHDH
jgi:membrane fusion protein, heavy metal efflux system